MNKTIKLDVFGKLVLAINTNDGWEMFYLSEGGKRRLATEIYVPKFVKETEIENYIEDICHEWATEKHPNDLRYIFTTSRLYLAPTLSSKIAPETMQPPITVSTLGTSLMPKIGR
jgi:hypothetical protein